MKALLKFLIKEFGFLFEDYPLESGIALIVISAIGIYLLKDRIFYIKDRVSILYYFFNLRVVLYGVALIGLSQILKGLGIYDSILKDVTQGFKILEQEYPIILGSLLVAVGSYFIYDKFKISEEEIEGFESNIDKYKFWVFTIVIMIFGLSIILRNI